MKKVLVVDDDADIREAFRDFLEEAGYAVICAADGDEALTAMRKEPIAVVLLDVMMPRMDGREFRRHQLADPALRDVPVIIITADLRIASRRMAVAEESGAWDLFGDSERIAKPLEGDELLRVLQKYC